MARPPTQKASPPLDTRAQRAKIREARELASKGKAAEAFAAFKAVLDSNPGDPRLHCETGYMAYRAGDLVTAEAQAWRGLYIYHEDGAVPPRAQRFAAMCHYNAGLVQEAQKRPGVAAEEYRASLALRPNPTVEKRLIALGPDPGAPRSAPARAKGAFVAVTRAIRRAESCAAGCTLSEERSVSPSRPDLAAVVVRLDLPDEENPIEWGCWREHLVVLDGALALDVGPIASGCDGSSSIFNGGASVESVTFHEVDGLSRDVIAVEIRSGGVGDGEVLLDIVSSESTRVVFCRRPAGPTEDWRCGQVTVAEHEETACGLISCRAIDGETGGDAGESPDDDRPVHREWGWSVEWALDPSGVLRFTQRSTTGGATPATPPTLPLTALEPLGFNRYEQP